MLSKNEAKILVEKELNIYPNGGDIKIYDEFTKTIDSGWVFFYNVIDIDINKGNSLIGNSPLIVNKFSGKIYGTGSAEPIEYSIDDYEFKTNGYQNTWAIRLKKKVGFFKLFKALKVSRNSSLFFPQIWKILSNYPSIIKEGEIRKVLPLYHILRDAKIPVEIFKSNEDIPIKK